MKINEVMKETNLTRKSILYYEQKRLIELTKDMSGYRTFTKEDIQRLEVIRNLKWCYNI